MTERPPRHAAPGPRPTRRPERIIPRAVNRPTPRAVPIVLDRPPTPGPGRKRRSRRSRWARSIRQGLRSRRGRWVLIGLVCVLVILIGLLGSGFLSSPAPADNPPAVAGSKPTGGAGTPVPSSPAVSTSPGKSKSSSPVSSDQAVLGTLRGKFPDNPLNHLTGAGIHHVTVETSSGESIPIVGWLMPTALSNTYGTKRNASGHWSLSERALGKGYLAAIFIQAGKDGTPVTCRVIVDGKVTNQETTTGAYGRTVCLG